MNPKRESWRTFGTSSQSEDEADQEFRRGLEAAARWHEERRAEWMMDKDFALQAMWHRQCAESIRALAPSSPSSEERSK